MVRRLNSRNTLRPPRVITLPVTVERKHVIRLLVLVDELEEPQADADVVPVVRELREGDGRGGDAEDGEQGEQQHENDDQSFHRLFLADDDVTGRRALAGVAPASVRKRARSPDRPPPLSFTFPSRGLCIFPRGASPLLRPKVYIRPRLFTIKTPSSPVAISAGISGDRRPGRS